MNRNALIAIVLLILVGLGAFMFANRNQSTQMREEVSPTAMEDTEDKDMENKDNAMEEEDVMGGNVIEIKDFAFSPATMTIKAGESVTWKNMDSVGHSATADDETFDTGVFDQGESETIKFDKAGTYTYHCTPHPNMKGTIIVEE